MAGRIDAADIPGDVLAKLGILAPGSKGASGRKRSGMSKDEVRSYALRALAPLASLTQRERARVLHHALKVNEV